MCPRTETVTQYSFSSSSTVIDVLAGHTATHNKKCISLSPMRLLCLLRNLWPMGYMGKWYVYLPGHAFKKKRAFSACLLLGQWTWLLAISDCKWGQYYNDNEGAWIPGWLHGTKSSYLSWNASFQMVTCERNKRLPCLSYCFFYFLFHTAKTAFCLTHNKPSEQKPLCLNYP